MHNLYTDPRLENRQKVYYVADSTAPRANSAFLLGEQYVINIVYVVCCILYVIHYM